MRVVAGDAVDAGPCREREDVRRIEGPQAGQIEYRTEIHEERIVNLAREHFDSVRQRVDGRARRAP